MTNVKRRSWWVRILVALCVLMPPPSLAAWSGFPPLDNPYNESEFLAGCRSGHLPVVRSFLETQGFDPDSEWTCGCTGQAVHGLLLAAQNGHTAVVQALVAAGANLDKADSRGVTPLLAAVFNEHVPVVQVLVAGGAAVTLGEGANPSPLMIAVCKNAVPMVSALLFDARTKKKEARTGIDSPDQLGIFPLTMAAAMGADELVALLLKAGADPQATHSEAWKTPLCVAAASGHAGVVDKLLAAGVRPFAQGPVTAVTPLALAASAGHASVTRSLARAGACAGGRGVQALTVASFGGYSEVVDILLEAGVAPNVLYRGMTPLMAAASQGCEQVVNRLIREGADPNWQWEEVTSPLFMAANIGATEVVRALLQAGARSDGVFSGLTPLFAALLGRHHGAQQLLVESQDIDLCRSCYGVSPLIVAQVMGSHAAVVRALKRADALRFPHRQLARRLPDQVDGGVPPLSVLAEARLPRFESGQGLSSLQPFMLPSSGEGGRGWGDSGCAASPSLGLPNGEVPE